MKATITTAQATQLQSLGNLFLSPCTCGAPRGDVLIANPLCPTAAWASLSDATCETCHGLRDHEGIAYVDSGGYYVRCPACGGSGKPWIELWAPCVHSGIPMEVFIPAHLSHTGEDRFARKGVDACIADRVRVLNETGMRTISSCCGHGKGPGSIVFENGTEQAVTCSGQLVARVQGITVRRLEPAPIGPTIQWDQIDPQTGEVVTTFASIEEIEELGTDAAYGITFEKVEPCA